MSQMNQQTQTRTADELRTLADAYEAAAEGARAVGYDASSTTRDSSSKQGTIARDRVLRGFDYKTVGREVCRTIDAAAMPLANARHFEGRDVATVCDRLSAHLRALADEVESDEQTDDGRDFNADTETTQASEVRNDLEIGTVIRVPQYTTPLVVTYLGELNGDEKAFIGVEFENGQSGASKSLITNAHSGRVYLTAGTTDKGEVREIEVL